MVCQHFLSLIWNVGVKNSLTSSFPPVPFDLVGCTHALSFSATFLKTAMYRSWRSCAIGGKVVIWTKCLNLSINQVRRLLIPIWFVRNLRPGFRIIAAVFPVTPIVQTSVKTSRGICCFRLIAPVAHALGKCWIRVLQSRQKQIQMTAINLRGKLRFCLVLFCFRWKCDTEEEGRS